MALSQALKGLRDAANATFSYVFAKKSGSDDYIAVHALMNTSESLIDPATSGKQDALIALLPAAFTAGGGVKVGLVDALPAGTAAIGKLAANSGIDIGDVDITSLVPGVTATSLGKAEDAVHASGDTGVMMLAVRSDTAAATGANGDYVPLLVDANGRLHVFMPKSPTIEDTTDVTLTAATATSILASDTVRRDVTICADTANTVGIRIGSVSVSSTSGVIIQPGQSLTLTTTAQIYGFATPAGQKVSILSTKDSN